MASRIGITFLDINGDPEPGLDVDLYYGSSPFTGSTGAGQAGVKVGDFTDNGDGTYHYDISETNQYTIKVGGTPQTEYTDIVLGHTDIVCTFRLDDTTDGSSGGDMVGLTAISVYAETTVQSLLEAIIGTPSADTVTLESLEDDVDTLTTWKDTITSTAGELNKLDGFTGVVADLELLSGRADDGLTAADLTKLAGIAAAGLIDVANFRLGSSTQGDGIKDILGYSEDEYGTGLIIRGCADTSNQINRGIYLDVGGVGAETAGEIYKRENNVDVRIATVTDIGTAPADGVTHFLENISTIWAGMQVLDDILDDLYSRSIGGAGTSNTMSGIVMISHTVGTENLQTTPAGEIYQFHNNDLDLLAENGIMSRILCPSIPLMRNYIRVRYRAASELVTSHSVQLFNPTLPTTSAVGETMGDAKVTQDFHNTTTYQEYVITYWWIGTPNEHFKCWALGLEVDSDGKSSWINGITWQYWVTDADDAAQSQDEGQAS